MGRILEEGHGGRGTAVRSCPGKSTTERYLLIYLDLTFVLIA